jgi:hypothetical protein
VCIRNSYSSKTKHIRKYRNQIYGAHWSVGAIIKFLFFLPKAASCKCPSKATQEPATSGAGIYFACCIRKRTSVMPLHARSDATPGCQESKSEECSTRRAAREPKMRDAPRAGLPGKQKWRMLQHLGRDSLFLNESRNKARPSLWTGNESAPGLAGLVNLLKNYKYLCFLKKLTSPTSPGLHFAASWQGWPGTCPGTRWK